MLFLYATFQSFFVEAKSTRDETGATAVEYGLLVGLIAIAIIGAVSLMSGNLSGLFNDVAGKLPAPKAG